MIQDQSITKEIEKLQHKETNKLELLKQSIDKDNNLSIKQKLFIKNYIDNGGNGSEAVRMAGYNIGGQGGKKAKDRDYKTGGTESVIAVENLAKPSVKKYLDDFGDLAGSKVIHIMNNGKEDNQLKAAIYTYDQVHGKATQKIEKTTTFSLSGLSTAVEGNIIDVEGILINEDKEDEIPSNQLLSTDYESMD